MRTEPSPASVASHASPDLDRLDWPAIFASLDARGFAILPKLLSPEQCVATTALYDADDLFRSRVVMARHG